MKKVLILVDGNIAKGLLSRLVEQDTSHSVYDIVYVNDSILPQNHSENFTFYKFDATSYTKLEFVMTNVIHNDILVVLSNKIDTLAVVDNMLKIRPLTHFRVYNAWNIKFDNKHIRNFDAVGILSNALIEQLPNVPVVAQNVGLKQGEIMEVNIPFGSSYAYRYIGSISQKKWKIFALYRNGKLVNVKPTLILKPNDVILIIGDPKVLLQVYSSMSKSYGHFPLPFGRNVYSYIDMDIQSQDDISNCVNKAIYLHERLKTNKLIIKIVRATTVQSINKIKEKIKDIKTAQIEFDFSVQEQDNVLKIDKKRFDIGIVVLSHKLLENKNIINQAQDIKVAIFKATSSSISKIQQTSVLLNNNKEYEQISPIIFDITSQLKHSLYLINSDPIGDQNRDVLIEHFKNLSDIYNQNIKLNENNKNPISQIKSNKNTLQILPLKNEMFSKRYFDFFSTNSDLISYDFKNINQILIPIIEEENINKED